VNAGRQTPNVLPPMMEIETEEDRNQEMLNIVFLGGSGKRLISV